VISKCGASTTTPCARTGLPASGTVDLDHSGLIPPPNRASLRLPTFYKGGGHGVKALSMNSLRSALTPRLASPTIPISRRRAARKLDFLPAAAPDYTLYRIGINSRAGQVHLVHYGLHTLQ
jgi:hypothetical protein